MIEDKEFEFDDGNRYRWCHDATVDPTRSWSWSNAITSMTPPQSLIGQLNRRFIEQFAADLLNEYRFDSRTQERVAKILKSMGATSDDYEAMGLDPPSEAQPIRLKTEVEVGPLRALGYKVGADGQSDRQRQLTLRSAFENELPEIWPSGYMKEWGERVPVPAFTKLEIASRRFVEMSSARQDLLKRQLPIGSRI